MIPERDGRFSSRLGFHDARPYGRLRPAAAAARIVRSFRAAPDFFLVFLPRVPRAHIYYCAQLIIL